MEPINVGWYNFASAGGICSFVFALLLLAAIDAFFVIYVKRPFLWAVVAILEVSFLTSSYFGLTLLAVVSLFFLLLVMLLALMVKRNEYKKLFDMSESKLFKDIFRRKSVEPEVLYDREEVYAEVYRAVLNMSRRKQGALITFMRKDNLLDDSRIGTVIKQRGVDINAPVTAELLETIFYEGTRLHDGAVIIKDGKIARASVFFQSTSRALTGKYGSRHQAAMGISENSDSVTIVVSEETGHISIAFEGELDTIAPDQLKTRFEACMASNAEEEEIEDL